MENRCIIHYFFSSVQISVFHRYFKLCLFAAMVVQKKGSKILFTCYAQIYPKANHIQYFIVLKCTCDKSNKNLWSLKVSMKSTFSGTLSCHKLATCWELPNKDCSHGASTQAAQLLPLTLHNTSLAKSSHGHGQMLAHCGQLFFL